MDRQQILAARNNPQMQEMAVRWYANKNASSLQRAGVPVNDTTIALSHFLGVGGAISVLRANPNTPLEQILPPNVIAANGNVLRGKTAGQLIDNYSRRYGTESSFSGGATPAPNTPSNGQELNTRGTSAEAETQRLRRQQNVLQTSPQSNPNPASQSSQRELISASNEVPLRNRLLELA